MTNRRRALFRVPAAAALVAAVSSAALAAPCGCKSLPSLEQELFEQEWLQREFQEYAMGNKRAPKPGTGQTAADALAGQVLADFRSWLGSPAGGGGARGGAPELGTSWSSCALVAYETVRKNNKTTHREIPFDEAKFRKNNCDEVANYLLTHEQKHVEQCKKYPSSSGVDLGSWQDYSAFDVQAYGAGIKDLRRSIANLARKCGWQGSTNATKKNPVDGDTVDVVPTMAEAKAIAKALGKGKKP